MKPLDKAMNTGVYLMDKSAAMGPNAPIGSAYHEQGTGEVKVKYDNNQWISISDSGSSITTGLTPMYTEEDLYNIPLEKVQELIKEHYPEACI